MTIFTRGQLRGALRAPLEHCLLARPGRGAAHIAPDCTGQNFYALDRGLRDLLPLYLSSDDFAKISRCASGPRSAR